MYESLCRVEVIDVMEIREGKFEIGGVGVDICFCWWSREIWFLIEEEEGGCSISWICYRIILKSNF